MKVPHSGHKVCYNIPVNKEYRELKRRGSMKYDIEIHKPFTDGNVIDYGIIKGNNNILFIKAGQDGSFYGYKNKYLKIAKSINERYGSTVICSSNPFDGKNPLDNAMEVIESYCRENGFGGYEIYYMGHSNGGLIGAWYGTKYPQIKRMLLVNAPLVFGYDKTKEGLLRFDKEQCVLIYGSLDESYPYSILISTIRNEKVKCRIIKGQDHHFSKDTYDFKNLPADFLYKII